MEKTIEKQNGQLTISESKLPTIDQLYNDNGLISKQSALNIILNHSPKKEWIKEHPLIKVKDENGNSVPLKYLSISTVEYIMTSIFSMWRVEIIDTKLIANSVTVTVRLYVQNPLNGEWMHNDGIGASPIQTDKEAGAVEFNKMKSAAIQMAAPAAESYAIKDAAEKFGRIFGKDLNRNATMDYLTMLGKKVVNE